MLECGLQEEREAKKRPVPQHYLETEECALESEQKAGEVSRRLVITE